MRIEHKELVKNEDVKTKPILKWVGGKSSVITQIQPFFPKHPNRYFEPFLGGGAVFFNQNFSCDCFLNDSNSELIELYEVVRDTPSHLMKNLDELAIKYSEQFYYKIRGEIPLSKIARGARTVFLNKTGFNGLYRQNSKGGFNVPFGKRALCPALYDPQNLMRASEALKNATLTSLDFESVINQAEAGDFVYCDPPYEPLSRTSSFNSYQSGGFSQEDQRRLKNVCVEAQKRGVNVIISNSSADFIKNLYSNCTVELISARRSVNSKGGGRGKINEVVVILEAKQITLQQ